MFFADLLIEPFCYRKHHRCGKLAACRPERTTIDRCGLIDLLVIEFLDLLRFTILVYPAFLRWLVLQAIAILAILSTCFRAIRNSTRLIALSIVSSHRKSRAARPSLMPRTQSAAHQVTVVSRLQTALHPLSRLPGLQRAAHAVSGISCLRANFTSPATTAHPPVLLGPPVSSNQADQTAESQRAAHAVSGKSYLPANFTSPATTAHPQSHPSAILHLPFGILPIRLSGSDPARTACYLRSVVLPTGVLPICPSGSDQSARPARTRLGPLIVSLDEAS